MRKQAKMTLRCMQALVRVQSRVLDQRKRLSHDGSRKSAFSDTQSVLESRYLQDISDRRSMVRDLYKFQTPFLLCFRDQFCCVSAISYIQLTF